MHSVPETASNVKLEPSTPGIISDFRQRRLNPNGISGARSLLVGRDTSWGALLLRSLVKFGGDFSFALPLRVTAEFVREGAYTLILIDSKVSSQQRRQLVSRLAACDASIFFAYPVENDCWWVPVLLSGEDCFGAPAFRAQEFLAELEQILRGRQRQSVRTRPIPR